MSAEKLSQPSSHEAKSDNIVADIANQFGEIAVGAFLLGDSYENFKKNFSLNYWRNSSEK